MYILIEVLWALIPALLLSIAFGKTNKIFIFLLLFVSGFIFLHKIDVTNHKQKEWEKRVVQFMQKNEAIKTMKVYDIESFNNLKGHLLTLDKKSTNDVFEKEINPFIWHSIYKDLTYSSDDAVLDFADFFVGNVDRLNRFSPQLCAELLENASSSALEREFNSVEIRQNQYHVAAKIISSAAIMPAPMPDEKLAKEDLNKIMQDIFKTTEISYRNYWTCNTIVNIVQGSQRLETSRAANLFRIMFKPYNKQVLQEH